MPVDLMAYRAKKFSHRFGTGPSQLPRPGTLPRLAECETRLDFVVLGAQKAGSTFLHQALQHHPELAMPLGEVPVFQEPEYSRDGLGWLDVLFADAPDGALKGIKRPDYLGRPETPEYLARHAPDAKLIVVLREPVARAVSAYYHYMRQGHIPCAPPEQGLRSLLAGDYHETHPRAWEILGFSMYGLALDRYLELFRRQQLLVLIQEEILTDPSDAMRQVYGFLGVDPTFQPPGLGSRELPTVYSLPRVRYLAWARALRSDFDATGVRRIHRPGLSGKAAYAAAMAVDRVFLRRFFGNRKPRLSSGLRRRLRDLFRPDQALLTAALGRSVECWEEAAGD